MEEIRIERLTGENFHAHSLDAFIRHQVVNECWRNVDGQWTLQPIAFVEDWSLEKCREEAFAIANHHGNMVDFGAFQGENLLGYITIGTEKMGTEEQYVQLAAFQVSEPFRGMGVGRKLFEKAVEAAKEYGAPKIYISAHSSKESQAAYKALGCVHAEEIIPRIAEEEPWDVQLEYPVKVERNEMKIEYRRLSEKELDAFIELRIRQLREEGAREDIDLRPALRDYYLRHGKDGTFVSWLAMDGGRIVGTSGMSFVEKPPYFGCPSGRLGLLSSMFTEPDYRRRGIARELLRRVLEDARSHGCGTVQITASDDGVKLYTACGFVHNGNFMQYKI